MYLRINVIEFLCLILVSVILETLDFAVCHSWTSFPNITSSSKTISLTNGINLCHETAFSEFYHLMYALVIPTLQSSLKLVMWSTYGLKKLSSTERRESSLECGSLYITLFPGLPLRKFYMCIMP